ncbi:MAG: glycosyltransferase family 2 protein [Prevotella sp.]|nr:glycosyltransferase family 2 protein [Prevotella sp.]
MHRECDISIITVNYNGYDDTCALLDTIPLNDGSLEVIVVDNASKRDEAAMISRKYPTVKTIRSERNLGFAGGNNLGIKAATGRYLFFINNDTVFKSFDVQALVDRLEYNGKTGMVCPKIRFAWGTNPIQYCGYTPLSRITVRNRAIGFGEEDNGQYDTPHPTPYAHGAAMMVKREVIGRAGMMPECFFLYYEELDWSMSITRNGYDIWFEPACTVYHKESRSTGLDSPLRTYYITRNRLLLVRRNFTGFQKYMAYAYLTALVAPRDIIRHLSRGHGNLAKATIKGIINFIKL